MIPTINRQLQKRITSVLAYHGLSIAEFARRTQLTYETVYRMLRGDGKPSIELLDQLISICPAISSRWLFLEQGPMLRELQLDERPNIQEEAERILKQAVTEEQDEDHLELTHQMTMMAAMQREQIEQLRQEVVTLLKKNSDLQEELTKLYRQRFDQREDITGDPRRERRAGRAL